MKTFRIANGDLVLTGTSFEEVTDEVKVRQDLGIAVREPYGCDRFHPQWGSLLDTYVGGPLTMESKALVQAEVARVVSSYMAKQATQQNADQMANRRSHFSANELVAQVTAIEVAQQMDALHVRVRLQTLTSSEVTLTSTVRL